LTTITAIAQARAGDFDAALGTARGRSGSYWQERDQVLTAIATAQAQAGNYAIAVSTAREIWPTERVEALNAIALAQATAGDAAADRTFDDARQTAGQISWESSRASALGSIAVAQAEAGLGDQAVGTAEAILVNRDKHLPEIAAALVMAGDRQNFKHLLLPSAFFLDAAFEMCRLLAQVYPEQRAAVVRGITDFAQPLDAA
jgi:hypothetical protein